jgi:uncharacterized protein YecA (UPF0149 family)
MSENLDQKSREILESLDVLLSDLTEEQKAGLNRLASTIRNPSRMTANEAMKVVNDLGLDIEALQNKAKNLRKSMQKEKKPKIGNNEKCPCNSGKKYKVCCKNRNLN